MSAWQRDRNYNWSAGSTGSPCLHAQYSIVSSMHLGILASTPQNTELAMHTFSQTHAWEDL